MIKKIAMWLFDNVSLGKLTPYVFGLAIGRMPHRINENDQKEKAE